MIFLLDAKGHFKPRLTGLRFFVPGIAIEEHQGFRDTTEYPSTSKDGEMILYHKETALSKLLSVLLLSIIYDLVVFILTDS